MIQPFLSVLFGLLVRYFALAAAMFMGTLPLRSDDTIKPAPTPHKYSVEIQATKLALATQIAKADRVQIFLLDYRNESKKKQFLPGADGSGVPTKKLNLSGDDIRIFKDLWTRVLTAEDSGRNAWCHFGIHGISFFKGKRLLFKTSVCWLCNNYYIPNAKELETVGLPTDSVAYEMFTEFVARLPIPKEQRNPFTELE